MRGLMRVLDRISRQSHDRAVDNARSSATELSQRRVEREEVELFLAARREGVSRTA